MKAPNKKKKVKHLVKANQSIYHRFTKRFSFPAISSETEEVLFYRTYGMNSFKYIEKSC